MIPRGLAAALAVAALFSGHGLPARAGSADWAEVEGSCELTDGLTVEQAKSTALNRARSRAVTKATGIAISDEAFVAITGEGTRRLFRETRALTAGKIVEEKVLSWSAETIQPRLDEPPVPVFRVRLQARVATDDPPDPRFTVSLELPRKRYLTGESLRMRVQSSADAYLQVFSLGADDLVRVVYPNRYATELTIRSQQSMELPGRQASFEILPKTVPGHTSDVEAIKVVATRNRVPLPPLTPSTGTVGMAEFYRWLLAIPARERAESTAEYLVISSPD